MDHEPGFGNFMVLCRGYVFCDAVRLRLDVEFTGRNAALCLDSGLYYAKISR